jgi:stage II sporulation protein R
MVVRIIPLQWFYLVFAFMVMIACWETNKSAAAVLNPPIPQDSIRLRILANSDTIEDQWVKRKVRDAIIDEMNQWVDQPKTIEEARTAIRQRLPELQTVVGNVLKTYHFAYSYQAELAVVPFPTKMYGDRVYPAGEYEALRVTLGEGKGQNWWCVLFPPLCFVDALSGEKVSKDASALADQDTQKDGANPKSAASRKEIRFFVWDLLKNFLVFLKQLAA